MVKCSLECVSILLSLLLMLLLVLPHTFMAEKLIQHITHSGRTITSPKFPFTYDFDGNIYEYIIETKHRKDTNIHLLFSDFQLDVAFSTLKIYDGKVKDNPPTSSWTGTRPPMFISSSKTLTLIFKPGKSQGVLHRFNCVGFKVQVSFHGDQRSRRSQWNGDPDIPRHVPLIGFCDHMHTTSQNASYFALSGYQVSPRLSSTFRDRRPDSEIDIRCFWSATVQSKQLFLTVKSSTRALDLYRVHNGPTSDDQPFRKPPIRYELADGTQTFTHRLTNGSFYVIFSGSIQNTDYFAFSFAPTFYEAVSLVKGEQIFSPTFRNKVCPFKICGFRCEWDWSSCHNSKRDPVVYSPDCDEYFRNPDVLSCDPLDYTHNPFYPRIPEKRDEFPDRCYRASLDHCDGFLDCPTHGKDEVYNCSSYVPPAVLSPDPAVVPSGESSSLPLFLFRLALTLFCVLMCLGCCSAICKNPHCRCLKYWWENTAIVRCGQSLRDSARWALSRLRDCCRSPPGDASVEVNDVGVGAPSTGVHTANREPPSERIPLDPAPPPYHQGVPPYNQRETLYDQGEPPYNQGELPYDQVEPPYNQGAPAAGSVHLPSYEEALQWQPVVSDQITPPPDYHSAG